MKIYNLSQVVGAGVIAASLTILPLSMPAQAQNNTDTLNQPNTGVDATDTYNDDNDFAWGWLGLLGLAGLAGLAGKKRRETVEYSNRHPDLGVRSASEYR